MDKKFVVAVKGLIINEKNEYLVLTKAKSEIIDAKAFGNYDLPGGRLEFGESLAEALSREVFEETGIRRYKLDKVINATTIMTDENQQLTIITYLIKTKEEKVTLSQEHTSYNWFSAENVNLLPNWLNDTIDKSR